MKRLYQKVWPLWFWDKSLLFPVDTHDPMVDEIRSSIEENFKPGVRSLDLKQAQKFKR